MARRPSDASSASAPAASVSDWRFYMFAEARSCACGMLYLNGRDFQPGQRGIAARNSWAGGLIQNLPLLEGTGTDTARAAGACRLTLTG